MKLDLKHFFQLLSDDTRLRCMLLIHAEGELCVCELVNALGLIQPKVSRHLAGLRDAAVLVDRREGQWIYYRLNARLPDWAMQVIKSAADSDTGKRLLSRDTSALNRMPNRPDARRCA